MAQNSARLQWTEEEVDAKLKSIMQTCFRTCYETGKEFSDSGALPSRMFLVALSSLTVLGVDMLDRVLSRRRCQRCWFPQGCQRCQGVRPSSLLFSFSIRS